MITLTDPNIYKYKKKIKAIGCSYIYHLLIPLKIKTILDDRCKNNLDIRGFVQMSTTCNLVLIGSK